MKLDDELKAQLVCPRCRGALDYTPEPESLTCAACKLRYPVEDGIPVMLIDEAAPL
ncbi:MAG: Trm112 family protein [Nitrospirota bacterium]|nr:Trm112 family protein [Nitrospirota bacterium]